MPDFERITDEKVVISHLIYSIGQQAETALEEFDKTWGTKCKHAGLGGLN
jgi:hypothetical protein